MKPETIQAIIQMQCDPTNEAKTLRVRELLAQEKAEKNDPPTGGTK